MPSAWSSSSMRASRGAGPQAVVRGEPRALRSASSQRRRCSVASPHRPRSRPGPQRPRPDLPDDPQRGPRPGVPRRPRPPDRPWPSEPPTNDGATGIRLPAPPSDIAPNGRDTVGWRQDTDRRGGRAPTSMPVWPAVEDQDLERAGGARRTGRAWAPPRAARPGSVPGLARRDAGATSGASGAASRLLPVRRPPGLRGAVGERVGSFARAAADRAAARAAERRIGRHDHPFDGEDIAIDEALEDAPHNGDRPPCRASADARTTHRGPVPDRARHRRRSRHGRSRHRDQQRREDR